MSKKPFKSQASSSRAISGTFGVHEGSGYSGLGSTLAFGALASSPLSYIYEPPDLSSISEPNIIVALKNLQKRDSTTKSRALEDLQSYVTQLGVDKGGVEDEMLEAWIKIYPRTSIDSARRVRQLAHILQGQISVSCGKRIARHMPQIAGPWLAGLYDNDKSAARAAHESLKQVFASEEKMKGVWRVYQTAILEHATDTIINETIYSISDERTSSPDDASAKYTRVVGSAILLVTKVLEESSISDLKKHEALLRKFLNQRTLWSFTANSDSFVRRAVYRLAVVATLKQNDQLDMEMLSTAMLISSLSINQSGSTLEYVKTLSSLTAKSPFIWTDFNLGSGKKAPARKLCHFLRNGSQGGPSEYWVHVATLLNQLPLSILLYGSEEDQSKGEEGFTKPKFPVLEALHDGIINRDEPRANQIAAWDAYLGALDRISSSLPDQSNRDNLAKYLVMPMVKQYVKPSSSESGWTILGIERQNICARAFQQIFHISKMILHEGWHQLSCSMIEDIRTSLPEQSEDYTKSHDSISANIERWYSLQAAVLGLEDSDDLEALAAQTVASELKTAFSVLREREGKPYSAAALVQNAIISFSQMVRHHSEISTLFVDFAKRDIPKLLLSPSAPQLIVTLSLLNDFVDVRLICESGVQNVRDAPESSTKLSALQNIFSSTFLARSAEIEALASLVKENLIMALHGDEARWNLVSAAVGNSVAPSELTDDLLGCMADGLSIDQEVSLSLQGLELVVKRNSQAIKDFARSRNGSKLLSKLLSLAESSDFDLSQKAVKLNAAIEAIISNDKDSIHAAKSMVEIISQGINIARPNALSIDSLVEQARKLLNQPTEQNKPVLAAGLLPDSVQWAAAIGPFYSRLPNQSMSIMNPLGGAINLIDRTIGPDVEAQSANRDSNGYSSALRMAWYVLRIVKATDIFDIATEEQQILVYKNLALIIQFATHNLSVPGSNPLWDTLDAELETKIADFVVDMQGALASWMQSEHSMGSALLKKVQQQLFEASRGVSAASFYSGCAYSHLASEFIEMQGNFGPSEGMEPLSIILKSPDMFTPAAILSSAPESRGLLRLYNELLADLTGYDFQKGTDEGFRQLVFLNCIIKRQEDLVIEIPQQRLVFFVKHVVSQVLKGISSKSIRAEILTSLRAILPPIKDIYDNFWAKIIDFVLELWSSQNQVGDDDIPILHSSLRLFQTLKRLGNEESNDDLEDAWKEKQGLMLEGLLNLLELLQGTSDKKNDPRKIVNELLARQIKGLSQNPISNAIDLYPAMASESLALQLSAYEILHHHIPTAQEQISLDRALEKDFVAKLPAELLSLVSIAPSLDHFTEASFERMIPTSLSSYLLSWKLIFDHWTNSSFKVKGDYTACLKDGTHLSNLLDFTFEILIDLRAKSVNASQFTIDSYSPDMSASPEKEIQRLTIHLYYLSLKYLPNFSKVWWRDTTTRQTAIAVEAWTEKYISPHIIASELRTVSEWAPSQTTADQPLHIKVSPSARELTASIPVDEQNMSIAIRLPPTYPLSRATVESQHRVAVDEKKWRGWLIATQGVINFSDAGSGGGDGGGPIIDGLLAWRRNVTATLKGQTECAICYSVVAADRQLPSKRCGTCRNCFHGSCLFRWFKSSNSSSCPLCRNSFHYG